jgi:hypothetical protein
MSEFVKWIEHKGVKILICDFSGITNAADAAVRLKETEEETLKQPLNSIRRINYVKDSFFNDDIKKLTEEYAVRAKPYLKVSASVGFEGVKAIIIKVLMPHTKLFKTIEEAKDWIITQ